MDRRAFLKTSAALPAAALASRPLAALAANQPWSDGIAWRTFEVTARIELLKPAGTSRAWLPLPLAEDTDYFRGLGSAWTGNAGVIRLVRQPDYDTAMLFAEWTQAVDTPYVEVMSRFMTRDRAVDLRAARGNAGRGAQMSKAELAQHLAPTELIPTDGIVRATALKATRGARGDLARARAIYEWMVENTFRDPKTRGCGWGDIKAMLETGHLGGKCGDLSALYVGLCRSIGIPARDVYGIRVADSQWGYKSLGKSGDISGAQHCRAEFHLAGHGWIPVDPADVRKVVLEEPPGKLPLSCEKVRLAHEKLFGAWEMNWLPYNYAHDVKLPGSQGEKIPYLMYPNGETASGRKDSLDPNDFYYEINSRELSA